MFFNIICCDVVEIFVNYVVYVLVYEYNFFLEAVKYINFIELILFIDFVFRVKNGWQLKQIHNEEDNLKL